jgi:hypothetical protein
VLKRAVLFAAALLALIVVSACGGGDEFNNTNGLTVTVSPATASVPEGSMQQFTATVRNSSYTTVTWLVNGIAGGNSTVGTISSSGLYTAPEIVPNPAVVTVTATLRPYANSSGDALVTITSGGG